MLFFMKKYTFNIYQYYGNFICKNKLFELGYPLFFNLNKQVIYNLFNSKSSLSITDANIKKYLNYLMNAYQNEDERKGSISEILKLPEISPLLNEKIKIIENIQNLNDLINGNEELKNLAKEEELTYMQQLLEIDEQILNIIIKYIDVEHYDNIIMEIVPGVGGQEAMLFAKDLLNMYIKYFNHIGFNYEILEILSNELNGLRKATVLISDNNAFKKLKYEGGVHRVQRIPATEKSGRLHTSTAVVTILPEPKDVDIKLEDKDLIIESKKASGAGGQHVNTTDSAIRITHIPTGTIVTCQTNRSQIKNKQIALTKLKSLLYEEELNKQVSFINQIRKKQIGKRLRNEKIRTYNFNQDRVTDHRIPNGTMYNLKEFMENGTSLEILEDRLYKDMQSKIKVEIIEDMLNQLK
ncbi:uncharacterized protein LOC724133 [Apis mellifera]|uniref:Uncharacterized protein LOC724133 n=1 Tax=Apis mellifera TaxID=7460 RepID=A0A7M7H2Q2_APIME|nr:uncharacterized protein LOC724133 [Apis mellifera]|eukprot:XP_006567864.2 uncharacterized protein LOC724133 [Apis mellifera]